MRKTIMNVTDFVAVTIASGSSLSEAVDLGGLRLFGVIVPSNWTAASMSFQMSPDFGTSWNDIVDQEGTEVTATGITDKFIAFDTLSFSAIQFLKVRSGTAQTPVNQTSNAEIKLLLRAI